MKLFLANVVLALFWGAVTTSFEPDNLLFGFVLGFVCLWLVRESFDRDNFNRPGRILRLALFFLKELILSAYRVAKYTVSPRMTFRPAIVAMPLRVTSGIEITMLANMISLTPGTLSVDVSTDRSTLYIHAMDVDDPAELIEEIRDGFERRIMEALG